MVRSLSLLGLLALALPAACPAAEAYRWVDEKGVVNYGEKPPASRPARPVDTTPGAVMESGSLAGAKAAPRADAQAAPAPPPPCSGAVAVRGMEFDVFIRLQRGMTEGEVLLRAGPPDYESVENLVYDIVKSYYYFPTIANPYTTVVTLRGGRVASLERIKKF